VSSNLGCDTPSSSYPMSLDLYVLCVTSRISAMLKLEKVGDAWGNAEGGQPWDEATIAGQACQSC